MESLIGIKKNFMIAGILVSEECLPIILRKYKSIINRVHIALVIIHLMLYLLSMLYFVLYQTQTFAEYAHAIIFFACDFVLMLFYTCFVWHSSKVSQIITGLENTIEQSKSKVEIF